MFLRKNDVVDIGNLCCDKDGLTATTSALNYLKKCYVKKVLDKFCSREGVNSKNKKKNEK